MAEKQNIPEIRFEGFTDPWEQRKFSDMYVVNNERNANCELGYDRTLSIATMTFNGGNGAADDSLSNYKVIRIGDIAFEGHTNKVHAYGRFVLNDAGDGLMSPRFSCLRPIVEQRYSFWKYYIPREESMRPILVNATKSGTMMNELVPDDLMRESILVPCLAEQEVIGNSLSQLDHLITLHQRKCQYRSLYGYLSWEQRKFSEIVDVCSGRDYKHLNEGPIPVYGTGGYMTSVCEALSHNRDAVGIGRKGTIDKPYLLKAPFWTVDTLFYAIPKPDINLEFALCSFLNVDWKSKDESTGLPSLSKEAINETVLRVPNAVEQNHLGSFFTDIDSLITLHQREPRFADTG